MEVVRAISAELLKRLVRLGDLDTIVASFAGLGFPNCGGALDGTHIPIRALPHRAAQFINRKGYFSMVLQALVSHRGQFMDISVGWLEQAHDARIFCNLYLYRRLQAGTQRDLTLGDVKMPLCIMADVAYPLMPWLMKPYTGHMGASKELFNTHAGGMRVWSFEREDSLPPHMAGHGRTQHPQGGGCRLHAP
nr:protein ALP1-like [Pelodiscus sinensis]|eukprot:XP_025038208.1 protein ALP1-like [Pelodiscus sinensis]